MTELSPRLPCPVCLGTTMDKVKLGPGGELELDHCGRCGGIWLEHGEVQRLRDLPKAELWRHVAPRQGAFRMRCHDCHAPLERAEEKCPGCGWSNVLDCPGCGRAMRVESHDGLRLDVCRDCKGVWFDHHELEAIWSASFDRALRQRNLPRGRSLADAAEETGDVLLDTLFHAPGLVYYGAHAVGHAVSASAEVLAHVPGAIASTPEAASTVFEVVTQAGGSVFEVIVEIIGGIFDGLGS